MTIEPIYHYRSPMVESLAANLHAQTSKILKRFESGNRQIHEREVRDIQNLAKRIVQELLPAPWEGRARCDRCQFWSHGEHDGPDHGECRVRPPRQLPIFTEKEYWCGSFVPLPTLADEAAQ